MSPYPDGRMRSPRRTSHGRGTGTLRRAIREVLGGHTLVTSCETAEREEGGEGRKCSPPRV